MKMEFKKGQLFKIKGDWENGTDRVDGQIAIIEEFNKSKNKVYGFLFNKDNEDDLLFDGRWWFYPSQLTKV